jgi:hypothetical protein
MNEGERLFRGLSQLARAQGLALLGSMMAVLFGFIVWARGGDGGVLSIFAGIAAVLFAASAVLGAMALVLAIRQQPAKASRRSRQGLWLLLAAAAAVLVGAVIS